MGPRNTVAELKTTLGYPPWLNSVQTRKVVNALKADGAEVRFVGGCVRDTLANRPVKDIDLATPTPPDVVIKLLESSDIKALPTGIHHGTVTAVCEKKSFQITTLRKDKVTDGRHAKVDFTSDWAADSRRRDFTINSLSADTTGNIYDYNDGITDLKHGKVRFIGRAESRIDEDYLRILRFFRFQGEYGRLPIDAEAMRATRTRAHKLSKLSGERIRDELLKILMVPDPTNILLNMRECGVLDVILPEVQNLEKLGYLKELEKNSFDINGVSPKALRRLAALFDPKISEASLSSVSKRLKLSNTDRSLLKNITNLQVKFSSKVHSGQLSKLLRKFGVEQTMDFILLGWANDLILFPDLTKSQTENYTSFLKLCTTWKAPNFPLTGSDALNLGIAEGPEISAVLKSVEDWWESNGYTAGRQKCLDQLHIEVKKIN